MMCVVHVAGVIGGCVCVCVCVCVCWLSSGHVWLCGHGEGVIYTHTSRDIIFNIKFILLWNTRQINNIRTYKYACIQRDWEREREREREECTYIHIRVDMMWYVWECDVCVCMCVCVFVCACARVCCMCACVSVLRVCIYIYLCVCVSGVSECVPFMDLIICSVDRNEITLGTFSVSY